MTKEINTFLHSFRYTRVKPGSGVQPLLSFRGGHTVGICLLHYKAAYNIRDKLGAYIFVSSRSCNRLVLKYARHERAGMHPHRHNPAAGVAPLCTATGRHHQPRAIGRLARCSRVHEIRRNNHNALLPVVLCYRSICILRYNEASYACSRFGTAYFRHHHRF